MRFGMLETIREFGIEQLDASGETDPACRRQLAFCLELVERSAPELHGPQQKAWLERLDAEHNNLRAALHYALAHDPAGALRLVGVLGWFWFVHGHLREGLDWLRLALSRSSDHAGAAHAKALTAAGMLLRELVDYAAAARYLDEAIDAYRTRGNTAGLANALYERAAVWMYRGEPERGRSLLEEGLQLAQDCGDRYVKAGCLSALALLDSQPSLTEQSLALMRALGDTRAIAMLLGYSAYATLVSGDCQRGVATVHEGLALARELEDGSTITFLLPALGCLALAQGDAGLARESFIEFLDLDRILRGRADIESVVDGFAGIALLSGLPERAARLLGAAEALREQSGERITPFQRPQYERTVAGVRAQLREADLQRAWATGRTMSQDEALTLALEMRPASASTPRATFPKGLTAREVDMLRLVAQGMSDAEVAERLFVARRTINAHLTSIYTKLGVSSRAGATGVGVLSGDRRARRLLARGRNPLRRRARPHPGYLYVR